MELSKECGLRDVTAKQHEEELFRDAFIASLGFCCNVSAHSGEQWRIKWGDNLGQLPPQTHVAPS